MMQDVYQKVEVEITRKWHKSGIINPLCDGLVYNLRGHFTTQLENTRTQYV